MTVESAPVGHHALERLQAEAFDALLISHELDSCDGLSFVEALRAGGGEEPVIVLGKSGAAELPAMCYEAGADEYLCLPTTATRTLLWTIGRAMERRALLRENRRLRQAEGRRLQAEHLEAERLLDQQRSLVRELEALQGAARSTLDVPSELALSPPSSSELPDLRHRQHSPPDLPPAFRDLVRNYRELLRATAMMGAGQMTGEIRAWVERGLAADCGPRQVLQIHLRAIEELVQGLGQRSTRHIMGRAEMLILDVLIQLAEVYRLKTAQGDRPSLLGCSSPVARTAG